jgi:CubicO group peptidase (beta-lactamase class C family)
MMWLLPIQLYGPKTSGNKKRLRRSCEASVEWTELPLDAVIIVHAHLKSTLRSREHARDRPDRPFMHHPLLNILRTGIDEGLHSAAQAYLSVNGNVVLDEAIGNAGPDSLMLWMSAGKPIAAVAALQLAARGALSLDEPVASVIPEFGVNGKHAITLRHLLTHTAGFRGPLNNFTPGSWEEVLSRVYALRQEPGWVPGEKAGYHIGSSWFVLGELIRRIDGRSFDAYVRDEVFGKLGVEAYVGMSDAKRDELLPRFVTMWETNKHPPTDQWPGNTADAITTPRPGANARGPIRSLAKVYESLLFDDRLLPRAWAEQLTSAQRVGMTDHTFKTTLDWGWGVMIDSKRYAGEHPYGYGSAASPRAFGHSGNQSSCAFADPDGGIVVAWCTNGMPGEEKHQARQRALNTAAYS